MGQKIKALREEHNLTLEQVGNAVGVGKSTVRKWENGMIANMRRDKIADLARTLHTTPAYLMGWETGDQASSTTYSENYIENLTHIIETRDRCDLEAAGINLHKIDLVIDGSINLSFDYACELAEQLGESIDSMLGIEKSDTANDAGLAEITQIFTSLDSDSRAKLLELGHLYADALRKNAGN